MYATRSALHAHRAPLMEYSRRERGRGERERERRRVFTFQISRRLVHSWLPPTPPSPNSRAGLLLPSSLYVFIIGTRLVIPFETCVARPNSLICHKSTPDHATVREFVISVRCWRGTDLRCEFLPARYSIVLPLLSSLSLFRSLKFFSLPFSFAVFSSISSRERERERERERVGFFFSPFIGSPHEAAALVCYVSFWFVKEFKSFLLHFFLPILPIFLFSIRIRGFLFSLFFFLPPSISSSPLLIYGLIIESFADPSFLIFFFHRDIQAFPLPFTTDSFTSSSVYLLCSSSSILVRGEISTFSLSLFLTLNCQRN